MGGGTADDNGILDALAFEAEHGNRAFYRVADFCGTGNNEILVRRNRQFGAVAPPGLAENWLRQKKQHKHRDRESCF